ncbi:unnamed protein product [Urochloa humidicola]
MLESTLQYQGALRESKIPVNKLVSKAFSSSNFMPSGKFVDLRPNKGSLLHKILTVTARIIQKDAEEKKVSFNVRPYFCLFINWLSALTTSDLHHDGTNFQILTAFANAFHILQPLRVPAWRFVVPF